MELNDKSNYKYWFPDKFKSTKYTCKLYNSNQCIIFYVPAPPLPTNRWMDKIFGWIPNAKRKTGIFYNEVLKSLYNSYWPYCGDHKIFRTFFMTERNRQYLYRADIDNVKTKIAYIKSENLACTGKFLTENYVPQPGDKDNIVRLTSALEDQQKVLEEINARLEKDDEALFCKNGTGNGRLKSGRHSFHHFNEDTMYAVKLLNTSITNLKNQLLAVKESLTASFWKPVNKKLNDKQRRRQNKWKCEKRTQKRKLERCSQLFEMLGGTIVLIGNSFLQRCLV